MNIRMMDAGRLRLRVGVQQGSGGGAPPPLIFNGVGANFELLAPFVSAMHGMEIVAFDVPGVGGSPAPLWPYRFSTPAAVAGRLLQQLGYAGSVDVLGLSWSGALAQQFAHQYPARCRRLVLAATSPGAVMVPGKFSVPLRLLSPRRYRDPSFLQAVGGQLFWRRVSPQPRAAARACPPHPAAAGGAATCTKCWPPGVGAASGAWARCASPAS